MSQSDHPAAFFSENNSTDSFCSSLNKTTCRILRNQTLQTPNPHKHKLSVSPIRTIGYFYNLPNKISTKNFKIMYFITRREQNATINIIDKAHTDQLA